MKKLFSLILIAFFATTLSASAIKTYQISEDVQAGIKEYRKQNYAGAMAEFKKAIAKNPNDSFAHYYLGNVYAAIGKNAEADGSYSTVINLNEIPGLVMYASSARNCLTDKDKCGEIKELGQTAEMTSFVRSGKFIDDSARDEMRENELKNAKDVINNGKDGVDFTKFKYLNDASSEMPSDKEIADAVKTLAKVGFNPLTQNNYLAQTMDNGNIYSLQNLMNNNASPELLQDYLTGSMFTTFGMEGNQRDF